MYVCAYMQHTYVLISTYVYTYVCNTYVCMYTYPHTHRGGILLDFLVEVRYAVAQEGLERVNDGCAVSGVVHPAVAF
jgi:hypothetical protein